MPGTDPLPVAPCTTLGRLVYCAGFEPGELTVEAGNPAAGLLLLPPGLDPLCFKAVDLAHMLRAYGLPYLLLPRPRT